MGFRNIVSRKQRMLYLFFVVSNILVFRALTFTFVYDVFGTRYCIPFKLSMREY